MRTYLAKKKWVRAEETMNTILFGVKALKRNHYTAYGSGFGVHGSGLKVAGVGLSWERETGS